MRVSRFNPILLRITEKPRSLCQLLLKADLHLAARARRSDDLLFSKQWNPAFARAYLHCTWERECCESSNMAESTRRKLLLSDNVVERDLLWRCESATILSLYCNLIGATKRCSPESRATFYSQTIGLRQPANRMLWNNSFALQYIVLSTRSRG